MSINLSDIAFLQSEIGRNLLLDLAIQDLSERHIIKLVTKLRTQYSQDNVNAALTMARLRQKAVDKFGEDAHHLFFTDDALQQASHPLVRQYRQQFVENKHILDVCCSIGADSLSFSQNSKSVLGLDIDPVRIAIAEHNAQVLDSLAKFDVQDVTQGIPDNYDLIFFDPARRDEQGKRIYNVNRYIPPLSLIETWNAPEIMVKLAPGVDVSQVKKYGGEIQFISVNGDMKEALLYIGSSHSGLTAILIDDSGVYEWRRVGIEPEVDIHEPAGWLCEPDATILRANLVKDVVDAHDGWMLDETIAYFTTPEKPDSVWVRSWEVIDWMPFNLKKLRAYLRQRNIGQITVKKRGSPITPEELTKKLKLSGAESCTLVLTQLMGQPIVIICENIV